MATMFVYVTAPSQEAAVSMGRTVVSERLAACANILPVMRSIYWWEGALSEEDEVVLILKTVTERMPRLTERLRALHPYEVPCIVALPVAGGHAPFLDWVAAETRGSE